MGNWGALLFYVIQFFYATFRSIVAFLYISDVSLASKDPSIVHARIGMDDLEDGELTSSPEDFPAEYDVTEEVEDEDTGAASHPTYTPLPRPQTTSASSATTPVRPRSSTNSSIVAQVNVYPKS